MHEIQETSEAKNQERTKTSKLLEKVISIPLNIALSVSFGLLSSTFNPFIIPRTLETLKNPEKRNFIDITNTFSLLAGYSAGIVAITYNIIENPKIPSSYIPLAANLAFFIYTNSHSDSKQK